MKCGSAENDLQIFETWLHGQSRNMAVQRGWNFKLKLSDN